MEQLLEARSPDALDDHAELIGCSVSDWPGDSEELILSTAIRLNVSGADLEAGEVTDELGQRAHSARYFDRR
jgi:hypothetical protein